MTTKEVLEQINTLNTGKSPGLENIHPRDLKKLLRAIANLLAIICNLWLQMASVAKEWWVADMTLIFQQGCRGATD